jgi:putative nucleotidyltransferase with HDIG domain
MAKILLLGSGKEASDGLRKILRRDGHDIQWLGDIATWRFQEHKFRPDLVVANIETPGSVLTVGGPPLRGFPAPLLLVERESEFSREPYLQDRLVDRLMTPFLSEELLGRVDALVRVRRVVQNRPVSAHQQDQDAFTPDTLTTKRNGLGALGESIGKFFGAGQESTPERSSAPYLEVAARVAGWADRRDAYVPGHAERVTTCCSMIADGLGISDDENAALLRAAMLHDIGKVALPYEVLHQKEPLDENQKRLVRTHAKRGASLLRALDPDTAVADTVLYHHECPNGSGYYGKDYEHVPRTARILAVAEVYDAMTSSLFQEPASRDHAIAHLQSFKGERFDSDCVEALTDKFNPSVTVIPLARS